MDEENNNNAKKVVEEGKKIAKEAVKEGTKEIRSKIIAWALPVLGWAALILLAVGAINLIVYEIRSFFFGKTTTSSSANAPASSASEQMQSLITFGENGEYKLDEEYVDNLIKELEEKSIDPEEMGYITSSGENMIEKYMEVELKTMLPKTEATGNDIDGLIKIQRVKADNNKTVVNLKYRSYKEYKEKGLGDDMFTIDPETFKILITGGSTTTEYFDLNGNKVDGITSENDRAAEIEEIDYQAMIQCYGVPFNFLLTLHSFAQDVDFMNDVVDEILKSDEPIVLSYVESETIETTSKVYTGGENTYIKKDVTTSEGETHEGRWSQHIQYPNVVNNGNVSDYNNEYEDLNIDLTWAESVQTTIVGAITITKADTWLKKSEKELQRQESPETQVGEIVTNIYRDSYVTDGETIENEPEGGKTEIQYEYNIHVKEEITTTGKNINMTTIDKDSEIKVDDFVDLIKSYPGVKNNFETAPSNIFSLLQENENTQTLEKIMRYVIYKLSGINYGVTEADLDSLFNEGSYTFVSSTELLIKNIRYWEYFSAPLMSADRKKYIICDDGTGKAVVGYGVYVEEHRELFESEGYPTEIGAEVDVEFVDELEESKILEKKDQIENLVEGLELSRAQINALILRSYDFDNPTDAVNSFYGSPSLNFISSYGTYWDEERDSKTEDETTEADFMHKLYAQYMAEPTSTSGSQNGALTQKRRQSEWTLFQTGYYDALGVWDPSVDSLVEAADLVHKAQMSWRYSVGGDLFWNDIESSLNNPNHVTCCATFVCSAIYVAGFFTEEEMNSFNYNWVPTVRQFLENAGWQKITSYDDLEPGDVVITRNNGKDSHVQLYAGDDTWYNAGSTEAIQRVSPYSQGNWARNNFQIGLRPK